MVKNIYQGSSKNKKEISPEQIVMNPIQKSGIENPNIFIQNVQMDPRIPKLNPPKLNLDLELKGFKKYYRPDIKGWLIKKPIQQKQNYVLNINPEKVLDPKILLQQNKQVQVALIKTQNNYLYEINQIEQLNQQLQKNIETFERKFIYLGQRIKDKNKQFYEEIYKL